MNRRSFTTYTLDDPALAPMTGSEAVAFATTRKPEDLGELDGAPTSFMFRRLTREQRMFAESAPSDAEKRERAFMSGIVKISGGFFAEETGPEDWVPEGLGSTGWVAMSLDERAYLEEHLGPAAIDDIGMVIYVRSWLRPKAEPVFPRSPSCLLAWDALPRPSAAPTQEDAHQSSGERKQAQA